MKPHKMTEKLVTFWAIWYSRRKALHENIYQSPLSTRCFIQNYLRDLKLIPGGDKLKTPCVTKPKVSRWIPPTHGNVKLNCDAAIGKTNNKATASAVARSQDGMFLGASSLVIEGITNPEIMEAIAVREALALSDDLNIKRVCVASDCLRVINTLHDDSKPVYAQIADEIRAWGRAFEHIQFNHEGRRTNVDAHNIARHSLSLDIGRHVWLVDPPIGICIPTHLNFE